LIGAGYRDFLPFFLFLANGTFFLWGNGILDQDGAIANISCDNEFPSRSGKLVGFDGQINGSSLLSLLLG
jgi:hypothetical protein